MNFNNLIWDTSSSFLCCCNLVRFRVSFCFIIIYNDVLADILTKGNFTAEQWKTLLNLSQITPLSKHRLPLAPTSTRCWHWAVFVHRRRWWALACTCPAGDRRRHTWRCSPFPLTLWAYWWACGDWPCRMPCHSPLSNGIHSSPRWERSVVR